MLCNAAPYHSILCEGTTVCRATLYHADAISSHPATWCRPALCCAAFCCTMLFLAVPCHAWPRYAVTCHVMLCHDVLCSSRPGYISALLVLIFLYVSLWSWYFVLVWVLSKVIFNTIISVADMSSPAVNCQPLDWTWRCIPSYHTTSHHISPYQMIMSYHPIPYLYHIMWCSTMQYHSRQHFMFGIISNYIYHVKPYHHHSV